MRTRKLLILIRGALPGSLMGALIAGVLVLLVPPTQPDPILLVIGCALCSLGAGTLGALIAAVWSSDGR